MNIKQTCQFFKPLCRLDIIALIISLISLFVTCQNNKFSTEMSYKVNSIEYKPILDIAEQPQILFYIPRIDLSHSPQIINNNLMIGTFVDSLKIKLKLINNGRTSAQLIAVMHCDTISGDTYLRELLLNKKKRENKLIHQISSDFYWVKQIKPNQSFEEEQIFERIKCQQGNQFCLHVLLLYKNDIGIIYDTYYWARYQSKEIFDDKELSKYYYFTKLEPEINGKILPSPYYVIDKVDSNSSNYTYSKNESKEIIKYLIENEKKLLKIKRK